MITETQKPLTACSCLTPAPPPAPLGNKTPISLFPSPCLQLPPRPSPPPAAQASSHQQGTPEKALRGLISHPTLPNLFLISLNLSTPFNTVERLNIQTIVRALVTTELSPTRSTAASPAAQPQTLQPPAPNGQDSVKDCSFPTVRPLFQLKARQRLCPPHPSMGPAWPPPAPWGKPPSGAPGAGPVSP